MIRCSLVVSQEKRKRTVNCVTVTSCSTEWLLHNYLPLTPFSVSISPQIPRQRSFNIYQEAHCLNQDWLFWFGYVRQYISFLMISQNSCVGKGILRPEWRSSKVYLFKAARLSLWNNVKNGSQDEPLSSRLDIKLGWKCHFITLPN